MHVTALPQKGILESTLLLLLRLLFLPLIWNPPTSGRREDNDRDDRRGGGDRFGRGGFGDRDRDRDRGWTATGLVGEWRECAASVRPQRSNCGATEATASCRSIDEKSEAFDSD